MVLEYFLRIFVGFLTFNVFTMCLTSLDVVGVKKKVLSDVCGRCYILFLQLLKWKVSSALFTLRKNFGKNFEKKFEKNFGGELI